MFIFRKGQSLRLPVVILVVAALVLSPFSARAASAESDKTTTGSAQKPTSKKKATGTKSKTAKWDPTTLVPLLENVRKDGPGLSRLGCHAGQLVAVAKTCSFGPTGKPRVLLFGDSHAAHWFGPVDKIRKSSGKFQLESLTKAACAAVDYGHVPIPSGPPIPGEVVSPQKRVNCSLWRKDALAKISRQEFGKLKLVVLSPIVPGEGSAKSRLKGWQQGYLRTLKIVSKHATRVLILRDMPHLRKSKNIVACIKKYKAKAAVKCGSPARQALNPTAWKITKRVAKKFENVSAVDLASATCDKGFCSPLKGRYIKVRDSHHYVNSYMTRFLAKPLTRPLLRRV